MFVPVLWCSHIRNPGSKQSFEVVETGDGVAEWTPYRGKNVLQQFCWGVWGRGGMPSFCSMAYFGDLLMTASPCTFSSDWRGYICCLCKHLGTLLVTGCVFKNKKIACKSDRACFATPAVPFPFCWGLHPFKTRKMEAGILQYKHHCLSLPFVRCSMFHFFILFFIYLKCS